jgi:polyisoprenoid-binding protein YceI
MEVHQLKIHKETPMSSTTPPTIPTTTPQTTSQAHEINASRWRIDPARSSVVFRSPGVWGLVKVKGEFERYSGSLDLRREPAIELTVEAASLNTHNTMRDKHLRSDDFFDVANHPQVRFVSDSATLDGEELRVRGRLYAAGESMPLDLTATVRRVGDELELDARTEADQHQLGMTHSPLGMVRSPSELMIHARLVRSAD